MTTADRLNDLITAKEDMKSAIEEKGVEVTGGLTSYADAIRSIEGSTTQTGYIIPEYIRFNGDYDIQYVADENTVNKYTFLPRTNCSRLFASISGFKNAPEIDTSNSDNFSSMFANCYDLVYVPKYDTSSAVIMDSMFFDCNHIYNIPELDAGKCESVIRTFMLASKLSTFGGLKNLGARPTLDTTYMFYNCNRLSHDSLMNIINNLYDRASAGYPVVSLGLGSTNISRLTEDEIAIATNKGWIIE